VVGEDDMARILAIGVIDFAKLSIFGRGGGMGIIWLRERDIEGGDEAFMSSPSCVCISGEIGRTTLARVWAGCNKAAATKIVTTRDDETT